MQLNATNVLQLNSDQCNSMQLNAFQCNSMQLNSTQCSSMQINTIWSSSQTKSLYFQSFSGVQPGGRRGGEGGHHGHQEKDGNIFKAIPIIWTFGLNRLNQYNFWFVTSGSWGSPSDHLHILSHPAHQIQVNQCKTHKTLIHIYEPSKNLRTVQPNATSMLHQYYWYYVAICTIVCYYCLCCCYYGFYDNIVLGNTQPN